jgi:nitrile hydratase
VSARFSVGDPVRTRAAKLEGHTRLPRYLQQRRARIERVHGTFPLADDRALGQKDAPHQTLYTVVFDGDEVWGLEGEDRLSIAADLWESYLEGDTP